MEDITINIPEKLGKFDIVKEIGSGSMAVVYLGYDHFMSRNVAIKVALPKILKDKNMGCIFEKLFFNEAHIAGMLNNRFILPVYDAGIHNDMMYIVMEYIEGGKTLRDCCSNENLLPIPKVLELIYKCCVGLEYAHSRQVIHRDIKPSNILLTEDMDVRIADFGIAQITRADETQFMGIMGSPSYMSPEQVKEAQLTCQSDIYSLGVVMYELLTGFTPFNASNLHALLNMILNEEPPLLRSFRPEIPEHLETVIKRALSKNCDVRYPTANDLASDLVLAFKQQRHSNLPYDTNHEEKFKRLKANKFFKDFFNSEITEVINSSEWIECRAGQKLIEEGELADSFYVIIDGEVEVKKGTRTLAILRDGDCFGEMAYFTKTKRTASIVPISGIILLKITSTLLEKSSVNCQLKFMKIFLNTLIERLSAASLELSKMTNKNIIKRSFKDTRRIR